MALADRTRTEQKQNRRGGNNRTEGGVVFDDGVEERRRRGVLCWAASYANEPAKRHTPAPLVAPHTNKDNINALLKPCHLNDVQFS